MLTAYAVVLFAPASTHCVCKSSNFKQPRENPHLHRGVTLIGLLRSDEIQGQC